jgi:hypothetical protein
MALPYATVPTAMDEAGRQHAMTRMEPVAPPATLLYAIASTISVSHTTSMDNEGDVVEDGWKTWP